MFRGAGGVVCVVSLLCACSGAAVFKATKTGIAAAAKPPNCSFEIFMTTPPGPSDELAVLDWDNSGMTHGAASDAAAFRAAVQRQVCELGGDAVVAHVNGAGTYVKGVVLRRNLSAYECLGSTCSCGSPQACATMGADHVCVAGTFRSGNGGGSCTEKPP